MNRTPEIVKRSQAIEAELRARAEQEVRDGWPSKAASPPAPQADLPMPTPARPPASPSAASPAEETPPPVLTVEELWTYMYPGFEKTTDAAGRELLVKREGRRVLLVDVRSRAEHTAGHIRGADTICLEPSVLRTPPVALHELQQALQAFAQEAAYFSRRAEYDMLVLYDATTRAFPAPGSATPEQEVIGTLLRALDVPTALLRGGFTSWARQVGEYGVVGRMPSLAVPPRTLSRPPRTYQPPSDLPASLVSGRLDYPSVDTYGLTPPAPAAAPGRRMPSSLVAAPQQAAAAARSPEPPRDVRVGLTGLRNFGQTCYMNATLQCLSATVMLARYMLDGSYKSAINLQNPLGTRGALANAFAALLRSMWSQQYATVAPSAFRDAIGRFAPAFRSGEQQDSQEFLLFLLDGLHEDLNRIAQRPPMIELGEAQQAELDRLPQQLASVAEWSMYRRRNDSVIVDAFQGQLRNQLTCLTCGHMSITYNAFLSLSVPVPHGRGVSQATLLQCIDAFVREEVLDKANAWNCSRCKKPRRATKRLSLSRLPPILLIHLKRFTYRGPVTQKIDTPVVFPMRALDLSNYMPPPLPPGTTMHGIPASESQRPPFLYDLYAVTHHFGSLSSGHYTASVRTQGEWFYCDDSRITRGNEAQPQSNSPYILWFRRRPL